MRNIKSSIRFVLIISILAFIPLIINHYSLQNVPVKRSMSDLSKSMYIFNKNLILGQDDPLIIEYIQKYHLYPPSKENYYLVNQKLNPPWMTALQDDVEKIFKGKRNGVFVEARACDGELISNTLYFEMKYNWTGLLIEPNPMLIQILVDKHRKAWFADVHIPHIKSRSEESYVSCYGVVDPSSDGRILNNHSKSELNSSNKMSECFPFFSILSATHFLDIDFLYFDIGGLELKILKTIPFEKINIKVFAVEFNHIPDGKQGLEKFMTSKGYYSTPVWSSHVYLIFIKNEYTVGKIN